MKYDLVFEGGGAKGMVFIGALQAFEAQGHTSGRLLGTSAGAITATLLAAGYTAQELLTALAEKQDGRSVFADFMSTPAPFNKKELHTSATREFLRRIDLPWISERFEEKLDDVLARGLDTVPVLRHLFSFIERGGWYAADNFVKWLQKKLDTGMYNGQQRHFSDQTLQQFYDTTQVDLSLIAADTTANQMLVLNHQTAPDLPVVWAVRMSMSIPFVWDEVVWQADWGLYGGRTFAGHTIVDGGLLSNFPIELFVSASTPVINLMGRKVGHPVLGMLIDEACPVCGAETSKEDDTGSSRGEFQTINRLSKLLNTMMHARDKMVVDVFEKFVVHLPAKGYGTTEFDMNDERRKLLVQAGQNAMTAYLEDATTRDLPSREETARIQRTADKLVGKILESI